MDIGTSLSSALANLNKTLSNVQVVRDPYPYFVVPDLFDGMTAGAILEWLEHDAPWTAETTGFYSRNDCKQLAEQVAGTPAAFIAAPEIVEAIRNNLDRLFNIRLSACHFELTARQMLPGHRIGIHNDAPGGGGETHNLSVSFNRGLDGVKGGHLVLVSIDDPDERSLILSPVHNSAVAMEFSLRSWHCVEEVTAGESYSVMYSFWQEKPG